MHLANMTDEEIIAMMRLRFRRIGLNSFRAFIYEPNGKLNRMYEEVLDAETCMDISNISLEELRKMPIEAPKEVEPNRMLSMREVLLFALLADNDVTPKIIPAKRLLAERLAMRGLTETDLFEISGGAKIIGARLVDKIANYLMGLCFEKEKVNLFIELAYQERWLDDSAVQNWFAAIGDAK